MTTLTSANSVLTLVIGGIYNVPQQLRGYGTDDAWTTDVIRSAQTLMGIDGYLSGGYVPVEKTMSIMLQADSPSVGIFETWWATQEAVRETFTADMNATLPSLGMQFDFTRGFLTGYPPMPDGRRILQPRRFQITWQSIIPSPL